MKNRHRSFPVYRALNQIGWHRLVSDQAANLPAKLNYFGMIWRHFAANWWRRTMEL
jgi:hypothetical protein